MSAEILILRGAIRSRAGRRQRQAQKFMRELEIVANAHCQAQRAFGRPLSNNTLMLALRQAFGLPDLGFIEGFCRQYVEDWTRLEESETHQSVKECAL